MMVTFLNERGTGLDSLRPLFLTSHAAQPHQQYQPDLKDRQWRIVGWAPYDQYETVWKVLLVSKAAYFANAALTKPDTLPISALPANWAFKAPITLPISCGPAAPVEATAAATAACTSASDICAGK